MHYSWTVAVVALVATSVSAFPLGRRGLVTADVISIPADDLVKRNYALDTADDKKHDVRRSLFSRFAEASSPFSYLHVPISTSKYVKRVAEDGEIVNRETTVPDDQLVDIDTSVLNRIVAKPVVHNDPPIELPPP